MSTITLKLQKTDSEFLEKCASKIAPNGEEWFFMPFWFNKLGEGLFVQYSFDNLPPHVVDFVNKNRDVLHQ